MKMWLLTWLTGLFLPLTLFAGENTDETPKPLEAGAKPTAGTESKPAEPKYVPNPANPVEVKSPNPNGPVYVFPLKEVVADPVVSFLRRSLKDAERNHASAFIIDMDTPGGEMGAMEEIIELLRKTKLPTYTFVNPNAASAGALIALGTKRIYMRPDAAIGAAAAVAGSGVEIEKTMRLKIDSYNGAKVRAVAVENGHNPEIAEAFAVPQKELRVGNDLLDSKETLLSLNGREAAKLYDGKPLLAAGLAESIEELVKLAKLNPQIIKVEASGFETFAFWITRFAALLLVGGIVGAYIEMKTPGFGLPGIISLICFGLYFGGHLVAGFAGYESVIAFAVGLVLVLIEIFAAPGTIIPGLIGVVLMLGALFWAMVDRWPGSSGWPSDVDLERPMINLIIALAGTGIVIALLAKILPKTALYQRLVLSTASASGPAVSVPIVNLTVKAGDTGTALTTLRPAGKAAFGDETFDVVTNGTFITVGARVRVVETDGMRVVVEAAAG